MYFSESPIVSVKDNFDDLLYTATDPARLNSAVYYLQDKNPRTMLRSQTSANIISKMKGDQPRKFAYVGDCYRRDPLDLIHSPFFHQVDIVNIIQDPSIDKAVSSIT